MSVRKRSSYICIYYKFSKPKRNVFMCITDRHISCNVEKINIQQFRDLFFSTFYRELCFGIPGITPQIGTLRVTSTCTGVYYVTDLSNDKEFIIVFHLHYLLLHLKTLKRLFPK